MNNPATSAPRLALRAVFPVLALLVALLLAGCPGKQQYGGTPSPGTPGSTAPSRQVGAKPYTIKGETYVPLLSAHGFSEEGVASWYGSDFHGKKTANGEIYDMYGMTAAHKLLPFGTRLKVTNLDNGRFVTVRVNDRGPFVASRIIDLTHKAASDLDMIGPGTARVRVESIGTIAGQSGSDLIGVFYVQVGAFSVKKNAHDLALRIQASGKPSRVVYVPEIGFHRVQVGPYGSLSATEAAAASLHGEFPDSFVVAQ